MGSPWKVSLVIMQLTSIWGFIIYQTAHRIWLRILGTKEGTERSLTMLNDYIIIIRSPSFSFVSIFLISLIKLTLRLKFSTDKRKQNVSVFLISLIKLILWLKFSIDKRRRTRGVGTVTPGSCSVSPRQKLLGLCISGLSRSFQRVLQSDRSDLSTSNFKDFF